MIARNVHSLLSELPPSVKLVAAAKGRTVAMVQAAIQAGVSIIGENYIQELKTHREAIGESVAWHFIGALQQNKVKLAVSLCDMIETVDSLELAAAINRYASVFNKVMPILIEVNSGREGQKAGILPEKVFELAEQISHMTNLRLMGLMTMGPRTGDPETARPYFTATRRLFEDLSAARIPRTSIEFLSMGMTNSYRVALEEGANIVRLGSKIFDSGN